MTFVYGSSRVRSEEPLALGSAACLLRQFANRGIEDFSCGSTLLPGNDERRAKAQGALTATEQEQTFLKALLHRLVAQCGVGSTASIGADEFHPDHQSQPAHIADDRVLVLEPIKFVHQVSPHLYGIIQKSRFDHR